jgi:hypothetical protein
MTPTQPALPRPRASRRPRGGGVAALLVATVAAAWATPARPQSAASDEASPAWVRTLAAPRPPVLSGEAGRWFPWDNQFGRVRGTFERGGIGKADAEAWDRQLRAIADFLKSAPVLASPTPAGFYPEMTGHIGVLEAGGFDARPKQAPLVGGVTLYAWPPRDVRVDAQGRPKLAAGAHNVSFRLELNYVYPPRGGAWMADAQGEFGPLETQGEFKGFPLVGNSLVLTRDGRLPFAPVTQERALQAFIAWHEKHTASVEAEVAARRRKAYEEFVSPEGRAKRQAAIEAEAKGVHPTMAEQARRRAEAIDRRREQDLLAEANKGPSPAMQALAEAKGRLQSMSAAERAAPAWWLPTRGQKVLELVPQATPGARPLVAFDPTFFDPKQPRATLRVALVRELHNIADCAQRDVAACAIYLQLLQQTDWRAFADRFLK